MVFFTHSFSSLIVLCFEAAMMSPMQIIISQWLTSLKHYLLMCLLLSSPDRLPGSPYPIALTGFSYFLLGLIAYCGLALKQLLARFQQTFSALLGINVIITLVTIPAYRLIASNGSIDGNMLLYVTLIILLWNLAVLSLIFKRAFEISTNLSAMIAFCYFVLFQFSVYWLSP
jgi:hypothetical protein